MRISPQSIEFGLWCNGSTTGFGSVCLGSNPGKPTEKEQWNPLLFFCLNNSRHVIFPIPLFVAIAPLFLPYILRYKTQGRSAQCILIPKLKHHFQSSPPVFPLGNIGGVPEGVKKTLSKKFLVIFLNPSPQKLTFLRSLPYILHCKTQGRRGNTNIGYSFLPLPYPVALRGTAHKIEAEAKGEYTSTSLLAVSRSIVGHGQGGGFN